MTLKVQYLFAEFFFILQFYVFSSFWFLTLLLNYLAMIVTYLSFVNYVAWLFHR